MIKKNKQKTTLSIILCLLIILLVALTYIFFFKNNTIKSATDEEVIAEIKEEIANTDYLLKEDYFDIYNENKEYSPYYKGNIIFETGIINEPFCLYSDNDYFLRRDFKTGNYSIMGTVFMDYECDLNSQNIVLYGHNAFSSYDPGLDENGEKIDNDTLGFTSLKYFKDKEYYKENSGVILVLENEIRKYEVVSAFNVALDSDANSPYYMCPPEDALYYLNEFSDEYFDIYKETIRKLEFYNTDIEFNNSDNFLTLQTCVEGNDFLREIVLCKEISRTKAN